MLGRKLIFHWLFRLIEWGVTGVTVVMCLVVFSQVLLRYLLDQPFGWTEEMGRVCFLIFVMLGAVLAYRDNRHLGLDIIETRLAPRILPFFRLVKRILIILFAVVMIQEGFHLVDSLYASTPILSIPFSKLYLIFPVTMILILILSVIQLLQDLQVLRDRWKNNFARLSLHRAERPPERKEPKAHFD